MRRRKPLSMCPLSALKAQCTSAGASLVQRCRSRKKTQLQNETRLLSSVRKFDDGCYTRMQFLTAASHSISHAEVLRDADGDTADTDDEAVSGTQEGDAASSTSASPAACDVCLLAP